MRNIKATKVIVSAYVSAGSLARNERETAELSGDLALVDAISAFREVTGFFDGFGETSFVCFLVPGSITEGLREVSKLAQRYQQNSILVIHGDDAAEYVEAGETDGHLIGSWQAANAPYPGEDWSLIDGTYYVVR